MEIGFQFADPSSSCSETMHKGLCYKLSNRPIDRVLKDLQKIAKYLLFTLCQYKLYSPLENYTKVLFHTSISLIKKQSDSWTCEGLRFMRRSVLVILVRWNWYAVYYIETVLQSRAPSTVQWSATGATWIVRWCHTIHCVYAFSNLYLLLHCENMWLWPVFIM